MIDKDSGFRPKQQELPPSESLREFYANNPMFDRDKSIEYLVKEYPDVDCWVVDSGIAIELLVGNRDVVASDIDIVCRDEDMEKDFGQWDGNDPRWTRYIDTKSINHWLEFRVGNVDINSIWQAILETSSFFEIGGQKFRIMHPAIIAAGKSTLARMAPRSKDYNDLALLNVSDDQLIAATQLLRGIELEDNTALLL